MDTLDLMREAEIRALDLVGRPMPDVLDRLARVAATVTGAPAAEIHIITSTSQVTLAGTGPVPDPCDSADSYCAVIVRETERTHVIPDVRRDERFAQSPFTTEVGVVTYAATQLVTSHGVPIGTLCVSDTEERVIDQHMMKVLEEVSDAAMEVIEDRRRALDLKDVVIELADGSRELRRSNEHLAAFAGQVSHDVQGPLAAVMMALQMMQEEESDLLEGSSEQAVVTHRMLLGTALSGADRMRTTIRGLMDFAVLGGTLVASRLDMDSVVDEVLADLSARRGKAQVLVGDLPKVWGDDVQVRALVQNLIANALKYAGDGAVIRVGGETLPGSTRITVCDNGPGVPVAERDSIFELLARGDGAEDSGAEGLGIGLATCRRIVEAHGGSIGVGDSDEGGAAFWFELPLPGETD